MLDIDIWVRVGNDSKISIDRDIARENPWEWMKPLTDVAHLQHPQSLLFMPFSYEWFIYIHLRKFIANFSIFIRTSRKENVDLCDQKILLCKQLEKLWFFFNKDQQLLRYEEILMISFFWGYFYAVFSGSKPFYHLLYSQNPTPFKVSLQWRNTHTQYHLDFCQSLIISHTANALNVSGHPSYFVLWLGFPSKEWSSTAFADNGEILSGCGIFRE